MSWNIFDRLRCEVSEITDSIDYRNTMICIMSSGACLHPVKARVEWETKLHPKFSRMIVKSTEVFQTQAHKYDSVWTLQRSYHSGTTSLHEQSGEQTAHVPPVQFSSITKYNICGTCFNGHFIFFMMVLHWTRLKCTFFIAAAEIVKSHRASSSVVIQPFSVFLSTSTSLDDWEIGLN